MTLAELSVLIPLTLGVLALVVKAFIPSKKVETAAPKASNPGNPGNNAQDKVDHALMLKSLERIEEVLQRIESGLP